MDQKLVDAIELIKKLSGELGDAVSFMDTFSESPEYIGCSCDADDLDSKDCECVGRNGEIRRITDKEKLIDESNQFLESITD